MALSHYLLPLQTFARSCFLMVTMREGRCANGQFLEKTVKLILQRFMKIFISLIITIILFYLFIYLQKLVLNIEAMRHGLQE